MKRSSPSHNMGTGRVARAKQAYRAARARIMLSWAEGASGTAGALHRPGESGNSREEDLLERCGVEA